MIHILKPHHHAHFWEIGLPKKRLPYVHCDEQEFRETVELWRKSHPQLSEDELKTRALAHIAWAQHHKLEQKKAEAPHANDIVRILKWVVLVLVLLLIFVVARPARAQFSHINTIATCNGANCTGANQVGYHAGPFIIRCSTNMSCTDDGTSFIITSSATAGTAWDSLTNPAAGGLTLVQFANGNDFLTVKRKTDTLPTGSFFRFQTALGSDICALSIAGVFSGCSFPYANLTGTPTLPANTTATAHNFFTAYNSSTGAFTKAQPACGDLSDAGTLCASSAALAVTIAQVAHKWLDSYTASTGAFTQSQPACGDLSNAGTLCQSSAALAATIANVAHKWLNSYTASTGAFTQTQPDYSDLTGTPTLRYQTVQDEGVDLTQRAKVNFAGAGVTCADNAGTSVTDCTVASGGGGMANPMTTLGDIIFEDASPTPARLAGNTTTTQEYLAQTGTGSVSAAPAWTSFFSTTGALFGSQYYCPASPATQATINTCLTAVASGGTVILPCNTTYTISTAGVSIANSNVRLTGCGGSTKLSTSGSTTFHAISTPNQCCLGQNTLSADALTGVTSVTAATNTGLVAGKFVRIVENSSRNYEEVARIKSISGAGPFTVNLDEPMYTDILVANGGIIQAFNPLTNVEIDHIALDGTGNSGVDSNGIYLIYCASCDIHDLDASNFTGSGLQADVGYANTYLNIYGENNASAVSDAATWWLRQTHSQMTNIQSLRATATAGFGLLWQYSHDLQVQGALATGGGSTGRGLKLTDTTHSQFVNVIETNFGNSQNFVLDSNSSYNRFSNCQAMSNTGGGFSTFGGGNTGNTFSNCMAKYNTAEAFLQSAGTDDDNSVIGGVYGYQRGSSNVFSIQSNGFRLIGATIADDNGSALKGVVFGSGTTSLGTNTSYSQNGSNVLTVTIANTLKKGDRVTIASATAGTCISAPNGDYQIVSATTSAYTVSWTQATCTPTSGAGTTARWQNQHATIVGNSIRGLPANEDIDISGTNVGNSQISFNQTPDGITRGGTGVNNTIFEDIGDTGQDNIQESLKLAASTASLASLNVPSGTAPTSPVAGDQWFAASEFDFFAAASTAGSVCPYNSAGTFEDCITAAPTAARTHTLQDFTGTLPTIVASGTVAGTTAAIAAGACGTTATASATGTLTTDIINLTPSAAITASNIGKLTLWSWVTANTVNINYCNTSAASITPTAMTFNWNVIHR